MKRARSRLTIGKRAAWLHEGGLRALDFARDGNVLTASDTEARVWVLATGELARRTERGPRGGSSGALALRPELARWGVVVVVDESQVFRRWDLDSGAHLGETPLEVDAAWWMIAVDPALTRAVFSTGQEVAAPVLVSLEDGTRLATLAQAGDAVDFLSDGRIVASDGRGAVLCWDADGRVAKELVPPRPPTEESDEGLRAPRVQQLVGCRGAPVFAVMQAEWIALHDGDGRLLAEIREHWGPAAFSRDGSRFAAIASSSGRLAIFDSAGRELRAFNVENTPVDHVAFSADNRRIATAASSGEIVVRSIEGGAGDAGAIATPPPDAAALPGAVRSLAADGDTLLISCTGGEVFAWPLEGSATPARIPGVGRGAFIGPTLSVLADGARVLLSGSLVTTLARDGSLLLEAQLGDGSLERSADHSCFAEVSSEVAVFLDLRDGRVLSEVELAPSTLPPPDPELFRPSTRAISNAGRIAWADDRGLTVWERDGRLLVALPGERLSSESSGFYAITFLDEDRLALASGGRGTLVDLAAGSARPFPAGIHGVLAWDAKRRRLAQYGKGAHGDSIVVIRDPDRDEPEAEVPVESYVTAALFLSDGSLVTAHEDRRVVVWETA